MRGKRRTIGRKLAYVLAGSVLAIGFAAVKPSIAGASGPTCSGGTPGSPATLPALTYVAPVTISGVCLVDAGSVTAEAGLTVLPGASLVAAFAPGNVPSDLLVIGNLIVDSGGSLIMGCNSSTVDSFPCLDGGDATTEDFVTGNLLASSPLGVIVHSSSIAGNVGENRGGGGSAGLACESLGAFGAFGQPVYSDFEDNEIGGSLSITNVITCYIGVQRNTTGLLTAGNFTFSGNHSGNFGFPNGNQVGNNTFLGRMACKANIPAPFPGFEGVGINFYTVYSPTIGQCGPISEGL